MSHITSRVIRRLLPLYIAAFFQGFVLWYAVEKLFMTRIGFDEAGIGLMIALYSAVMLIVETPSGILADRWSRKGVLILASLALACSSLIGGLSTGPAVYLVSSALWGVFFALYSGTHGSIIYDTLLEEAQAGKGGAGQPAASIGEAEATKDYDRLYGRMHIIDSLALVTSSLAGGLLASTVSLPSAYFASVAAALVSVVALLLLREPTLHKAEAAEITIGQQLRATFKAVLGNRLVLPIMAGAILIAVIEYMLLEFSQLWIIALDTPLAWFGAANALLLSGLGLGGWLAGLRWLGRRRLLALCMAGFLASTVGLVLLRDVLAVVAVQVVLCTCVTAAAVTFNGLLNDQLSSSVRAGASSAINTFGRFIIIPTALLFGYVSREADIFRASWLLVGFAVAACLLILWRFMGRPPAVNTANAVNTS